jgi:hypothetical protein
MEVVFANEKTSLREFHDFARVGGIRIDGVAIADQQMSVRRESQRQRTTQARVSEDQSAGSRRCTNGAGTALQLAWIYERCGTAEQ